MQKLALIHREILRRMFVHHYIGGRHTDEKNVLKFLPKHERGIGKDALDDLIKWGFVMEKITSYGRHVSLNPRAIGEVRSILIEEQ